MSKEPKKPTTYDYEKEIDKMGVNAKAALNEYLTMDQEKIDAIVNAMTIAGNDAYLDLAELAVEDTGRGIVEDKVIKNIFATEYIQNYMRKQKTVGIIEEDDQAQIVKIAEPVGVVAAATPVTNPTSTTMFKALICAKTRNPIIFSFHPSATKCSIEAARVVRDAAIEAGAPKDCIQWIEEPSIAASGYLMNHDDVDLVLATGGPGMVKAAYSTGKPALGVGAGNVPVYVHNDVDIERVATDIVTSKTFDNGMICASEQAVMVRKDVSKEFEDEMKKLRCYFLNEDEIKKVSDYMFQGEKNALKGDVPGQTAHSIAKNAGVNVPENTTILMAKLPKVGKEYPLSKEKLSPVLAYYVVKDEKEGFEKCDEMLELGGLGHTACIHTNNDELLNEFGKAMRACRILNNQPTSQGGIGDVYNNYIPSLTLGCGSYGKNATSQSVNAINLLNIKHQMKRRNNMQWFEVPNKIFFERGSIAYLQTMKHMHRVFIVTDPGLAKLGYVEKIRYHLERNQNDIQIDVFSDVEPDPTRKTVEAGAEQMKRFQPDAIIALGGGSAMDAAKGMWLFYEQPDVNFEGLRMRFLDIRKRAYLYPEIGKKSKLICVPTTSGTGSEVTSFAVITDKEADMKYPLADYELTPDVAIIDPQFVMTVPKGITADTGMDVLTHAMEAYVSIMANDYTDPLCLAAIKMVFEYLPRAYNNPGDEEAREKMHNASCMAGMAFTNAFLGINHSLAHKIGAEFGVAHGKANAILLPYVIAYNAEMPDKHTVFPKYGKFVADKKYAEIARYIGLEGKDDADLVKKLIAKLKDLMKELDEPMTFKETGVDEECFKGCVEKLARKAFDDQCTTANPRYPYVSDLKDLYLEAYYGKKQK